VTALSTFSLKPSSAKDIRSDRGAAGRAFSLGEDPQGNERRGFSFRPNLRGRLAIAADHRGDALLVNETS
jgi:hypothetical protein